MNTIKFTAKAAHASKERDFYMHMTDYTHYVILQKAFKFDEQDVQGLDGEYLEVDRQSRSGYKCCKRAFIGRELFTLDIDSGKDDLNRVEVLLGEVKIGERLLKYLREILGDKLEIHEELNAK